MTRIGAIIGLLVATAALARAQDEAQAKAAVNRARESLQAFDGADLERRVDVDAKRARFIRDCDDALAEVDLLPPGPARDIGGHSLNRIVIDALFARGLSTAGLNQRVSLITPDEARARLDRTVLGQDAEAVEYAVRRVHWSAVERKPGSYRVQPDFVEDLEADLDRTAQALRALLPTQKRYVQLLGSRLTAAVREWRKKELLVESPDDRNWTKIEGVGTIVDKAWLDARLPPFVTQRSQIVCLGRQRAKGAIVWNVYGGRPYAGKVIAEAELIAPDGRLVARAVGPEGYPMVLPFPAGTQGEGYVIVSTLRDPNGTVHTTSTLVATDWFEQPEEAETAGLVGGLSR